MMDLDRAAAEDILRYEGLEPSMSTLATRARQRRRTRRASIIGAISILVVALGAVGALLASRPDTQRLDTAARSPSPGDTTSPPLLSTTSPSTLIPSTVVGPIARCGSELPIDITLAAPAQTASAETATSDDGVLVRKLTTSSGTAVEILWPARSRMLYDLEVAIPLFFPVIMEVLGPAFQLTALTPTEEPIEPVLRLRVPVAPRSADDLPSGCAVLEVVIVEQGQQVANYGWDLTKSDWQSSNGATGFPVVNLAPLITSTEHVTDPPASAIGCDANTVTPDTIGGSGDTNRSETPADALAAFLDTEPAETFIKSGFHEMVADDGSYTYGIVSDIPTRTPRATDDFVTLITTTNTTDGWQVTEWTASGC